MSWRRSGAAKLQFLVRTDHAVDIEPKELPPSIFLIYTLLTKYFLKKKKANKEKKRKIECKK